MSSDYEYSDGDFDYDDDEEMLDATQDDRESLFTLVCVIWPAIGDSDDMMEYGGDDEFRVPFKGKRKQYEVDYESLNQSAVEKLMADDVEYVRSVCGVDVGIQFLLIWIVI